MTQMNVSEITDDQAIKIRRVLGMSETEFANMLNETIMEFFPDSRLTNLD